MRKIDAESFNKRLVSEILELKNLIENISPEHVNQFSAELIGTANQYLSLLTSSTWADNSNFNSIELSKLKQLINYVRTSLKVHVCERKIVEITESAGVSYNHDISGNITGIKSDNGVYSDSHTKLNVPSGYDGRNSFIYPRILIVTRVYDEEDVVVGYRNNYMSTPMVLLHSQGSVSTNPDGEFKTNAVDGDINSRLLIVKNQNNITINHNINLRKTYSTQYLYDEARSSPFSTDNPTIDDIENRRDVESIFLDVFMLYWRNK